MTKEELIEILKFNGKLTSYPHYLYKFKDMNNVYIYETYIGFRAADDHWIYIPYGHPNFIKHLELDWGELKIPPVKKY